MLNKPIYAGFTILEISKLKMLDFHYNFVKAQYGDKAKLLLTDTDSLVYELETDDLYKDLLHYPHLFDNSVYPKSSPLYSEENKKKAGTFKDEFAGRMITECVALRPKLYSILDEDGSEKKVGKGIVRSTMKRMICHEDYKRALFEKTSSSADMFSIRSTGHELHTIRQRKATLCAYDNKRYILDDGIATLAHGHYMIGGDDEPARKKLKSC